MSETALYTTGANRIIAGGMVLASPVVQAGRSSILQIDDLLGMDLYDAVNVPVYDISALFAAFYSASDMAAEVICKGFAVLIRENTHRPELRARTTDALSNEIRNESFRKFDDVLRTYASTMQQLGIELENRSTIGAAVNGALTGGGLQFLMTDKASKTGAIAGALIFAAIENAQKEQLRQQLVQCAVKGMHDLISIIPQLSDALMDQFATLIFGSEIDFRQRDNEIARTQAELMAISQKAETLLNDVCSYSEASRKIEAAINRKVFLFGGPRERPFQGVFERLKPRSQEYKMMLAARRKRSLQRFLNNPIKGFLKGYFSLLVDPHGKKGKMRDELQSQMQPELKAFKSRMEATLTDIDVLERNAKQLLA